MFTHLKSYALKIIIKSSVSLFKCGEYSKWLPSSPSSQAILLLLFISKEPTKMAEPAEAQNKSKIKNTFVQILKEQANEGYRWEYLHIFSVFSLKDQLASSAQTFSSLLKQIALPQMSLSRVSWITLWGMINIFKVIRHDLTHLLGTYIFHFERLLLQTFHS